MTHGSVRDLAATLLVAYKGLLLVAVVVLAVVCPIIYVVRRRNEWRRTARRDR